VLNRAPDDVLVHSAVSGFSCGDHKVIWELNRHQHWLMLGRAFWLTGEAKYARAQSPNWRAGSTRIHR
jgi:hypothetical protein